MNIKPLVSKALVLGLVWFAHAAHAQTTPPATFSLMASPAPGTVFIELTVNLLTLTISNYTNFTNITVTATTGTNTLNFFDNGARGDVMANDGIFSANFTPPKVFYGTNMIFNYLVIGDDITDPANPQSVTSKLTTVYGVAARPVNDNFTNAIKIASAGGIIIATNNYASLQGSEPQHAQVPSVNESVWWDWSYPTATNVLMDLAGSSFSAVLAVYSGSTLASLVPVVASTGDPNFPYLKPYVVFNVAAGTTYRIAVAGMTASDVGNIRLRVLPGGIPDTTGPSVTILDPAAPILITTNIITISGTAKDRVNDSGLSQVFVQVNTLTPLLATGTNNWQCLITNLPPGTNTISAYATDIAGNTGALAQVQVTYMNPTNDMFAYPIALTGVAGTVTAINGRATKEPGEPNHGGNDGGHSIWYTFQSPFNGNLTLTVKTNSTFDTLLAVYSGNSVSNLSLVASNDDITSSTGLLSQVIAPLAGGTNYYIAVDGYGGASGNVTFTYAFTSSDKFYNLVLGPPLGGSVTPGPGLYLANSTVTLTATPQRDFDFVGWTGDATTTANPFSFVMSKNITLAAQFRVKTYTDLFDNGLTALPWTSAGNAAWFTQSQIAAGGGGSAARSGAITDGQSSSLVLSVTTFENIGSFDYRVSSEAGFDFLEFYMNGTRLGRWSGDTGWQTFQFPVPAGATTFEWRYVKDANFSQGLDAAFMDNLYLPVELPNVNSAALMGILSLPNNQSQIQIKGQVNRTYVVQTSTNLTAWTGILTNFATNGAFSFTETQQSASPQKFYRALAK